MQIRLIDVTKPFKGRVFPESEKYSESGVAKCLEVRLMTWRNVVKYIIVVLVLCPVLIESYTIIVYHGIYAGGRFGGGEHGYSTFDHDPVTFIGLAILYSIIGIPVIVGSIWMLLVDLGIVRRESFYVSNDNKDEE